MAMDRSGVQGIKKILMNMFDTLFFSLPFMTEIINQVASKNLGLLAAWHFLSRTEVEGDYFEFGVFRGETFKNAIRSSQKGFRETKEGSYQGRFFAFDSFEGLPDVSSMGKGSNLYAPGEFSASRKVFDKTLGKLQFRYPVTVTKGWFDRILTAQLAKELNLKKAAFVNIDVDLYESTVPVLNFMTPFLQTGTIIYFDDWFSLKGDMQAGEALACAEWLEENPKISLIEYRNLGVTGKMFIVNLRV